MQDIFEFSSPPTFPPAPIITIGLSGLVPIPDPSAANASNGKRVERLAADVVIMALEKISRPPAMMLHFKIVEISFQIGRAHV